MSVFIPWMIVVLTTVIGTNKLVERHRHGLEKKCQCVCGSIFGYWPWVQQDIKIYIQPGETVELYPWFAHGPMFCAASRQRIQEVQGLIDLDTRVRLLKEQ